MESTVHVSSDHSDAEEVRISSASSIIVVCCPNELSALSCWQVPPRLSHSLTGRTDGRDVLTDAEDYTALEVHPSTDLYDSRSERRLAGSSSTRRVLVGTAIGALDSLMAVAASSSTAETGSRIYPSLGAGVPAALAAPSAEPDTDEVPGTAESTTKPTDAACDRPVLSALAFDASGRLPAHPSAPPSEHASPMWRPHLHVDADADADPPSSRALVPLPSAPPTEDAYVHAAGAISPRAVEYFEPRLDKLGVDSHDPGVAGGAGALSPDDPVLPVAPHEADSDPQPQTAPPTWRWITARHVFAAAAACILILAGESAE